MRIHWAALGVGAVIGAALAWFMTGAKGKGGVGGTDLASGGGTKITGTINAPFQRFISRS